jgi:hypothetical protein
LLGFHGGFSLDGWLSVPFINEAPSGANLLKSQPKPETHTEFTVFPEISGNQCVENPLPHRLARTLRRRFSLADDFRTSSNSHLLIVEVAVAKAQWWESHSE